MGYKKAAESPGFWTFHFLWITPDLAHLIHLNKLKVTHILPKILLHICIRTTRVEMYMYEDTKSVMVVQNSIVE